MPESQHSAGKSTGKGILRANPGHDMSLAFDILIEKPRESVRQALRPLSIGHACKRVRRSGSVQANTQVT